MSSEWVRTVRGRDGRKKDDTRRLPVESGSHAVRSVVSGSTADRFRR